MRKIVSFFSKYSCVYFKIYVAKVYIIYGMTNLFQKKIKLALEGFH